MKRILSLALVFVMCLSMLACGNSAPADSQSEKQPEQTAVSQPDEAPETTAPAQTTAATEPPSPFAHLEEDYTITLPIYTLSSYYTSILSSRYNFHEVAYDEQGRIISWEEQEDDSARRIPHSIVYNEDGTRASYTDHDSLYGSTCTYAYNEYGQLQTTRETEPDDAAYYLNYRYVYDENGMVSEAHRTSSSSFYDGDVFRYSYEFDDRGLVVKYTSDLDSIKSVDVYEYTYNDAFQVVSEKESCYDSGKLEQIFELTYKYNMYGFPVYCHVNNSYDYKNDTTTWYHEASYAVTGQRSLSSVYEESLNPVSLWAGFADHSGIPTPDSVLSSLSGSVEENGTYRYAILSPDTARPEHDIYRRLQALDPYGSMDITAYSAHSSANDALWSYEAVLTQLLGMESTQEETCVVITDGSVTVTLSLEFSEGIGYLVVTLE